MTDELPFEDPGWRPAFSGIGWLPLPTFVTFMLRGRERAFAAGSDVLTMLRRKFVSFAGSLVLVALVVAVISTSTGSREHALPAVDIAVILCLVGGALVIGERLIERPLDCTTSARLAGAYRIRFFVRLAFAHTTAFLGFVGFILTNRGWLYPLGAAFALIGYLRLAPTHANLTKDQNLLAQSGCALDLIEVLGRTPPPRSRP